MTRAEELELGRRVREIRQAYERALGALARLDKGSAENLGTAAKDGRKVALEAHARKYLLDPLLETLGWDLSDPASMVVEDGVDPVSENPNSNRRFLDYHGRSTAPMSQGSLLIVEAKRPSIALPSSSDIRDLPASIAAAVLAISRANASSAPVSAEWSIRLQTLCDYVARASRVAGLPKRAVITNGDWFIVFHEASSLLSSVSLAQISIFGDLDDVEARIGELYELLSYQALSGVVPEQSPASLPKFLRSKGRAPAVLGWIVSANSYGERQLAIAVRVIAWVKIDGGGWIRFAKKYAEDFLVLSHEPSRLRETLRILKGRSNELLDSLGRKNIKLISAAAAEAMDPGANAPLSGSPPGNLCDRLGQGKYIVTLGKQTSYLISDRTWDDCAYHYYGRCKDAGSAASQHPIESPNTDPPTLFPSGSPFHCAHDNVHRAREEKCVVAEFESFLCCRKCAFFDRCWPDGGEGLPCVTNYEAK